MPGFPQHGGCLCGAVRYVLREDPVTVYLCHCTDCQTESGSIGYLGIVSRAEALEFEGAAERWETRLPDGRVKGGLRCGACGVTLGGGPGGDGLASIDAGTLDDTSWIRPAAHIWTRSAQPWVRLPEEDLRYEQQPTNADWIDITRAWKARSGA